MSNSELINRLMFDFEGMSELEIIKLAHSLPRKLARWVAINHPDNRTRKEIFRATGVRIGPELVVNYQFCVADAFEPLVEIGARVSIAPYVTVVAEIGPEQFTFGAPN